MNPLITVPRDAMRFADLVLVDKTTGPSDTLDLKSPLIGFMLLVAGDLKVTTMEGRVRVLSGYPVGVQISLQIKRVWNTGSDPATLAEFFPAGS